MPISFALKVCSLKNPIKHQYVYLCRGKLNSTCIRISLHMKFNKNEKIFFSYYKFTLRTLHIVHEYEIKLNERYERHISDYVQVNLTNKENNTINIHNLPPGHYEICVRFFNDKDNDFYYGSLNSCLHIPWYATLYRQEQANLKQILVLITIIILLAMITFFMCTLHQYILSLKTTSSTAEEDNEPELVKLLIDKHFVENISPMELLVRKRIHQRYAHRLSDSNNTP